ncbi:MAG: T9SS type A sorting domain-containing protein [Bacteroidota bacterium]
MKRVAFPILVISCLLNTVLAQNIVWKMEEENIVYRSELTRPFPSGRNTGPDTLQISQNNPFFDDFSNGTGVPDTTFWYTPASFFDVPEVTFGKAINPPSQGVATFDGIARDGSPYVTNGLASGTADRLFTQCLDLSSYSTADEWVLTFSLQPQGRGDKPETSDEFQVYFKTQQAPPNDFKEVLAVSGTPLKSFQTYSLRLDDPEYFQDCFQIVFASRGSLSLPADNWHLDYVYLAPSRNLNDTTFNDASSVALSSSPLGIYTSLPRKFFNQGNELTDFTAEVTYKGVTSTSVGIELQVADQSGNNTWNGNNSQSNNLILSTSESGTALFTPFSQQQFTKDAVIETQLVTSYNGDEYKGNDTLRVNFPIDSILAYDDGEADGIFGLNRALGFGIEVNAPAPDTISAVWLHFEPLVHVNTINGTVTYMNNENFRLVIWNKPNPDSTLVTKIHPITYTEGAKGYVRYAFNRPVPVPANYYVGVQQMTDLPVGVGVDKNYLLPGKMYYDSLGTWTNLAVEGSFMIRPESSRTGLIAATLEEGAAELNVNLYPNPSHGREVYISLPASSPTCKLVLRDLLGQVMWEGQGKNNDAIDLPNSLLPGIYIWEISVAKKSPILLKWIYSWD